MSQTLSDRAVEFKALEASISAALKSGTRPTSEVVTEVAGKLGKAETTVLDAVHELLSRNRIVLTTNWQLRLP